MLSCASLRSRAASAFVVILLGLLTSSCAVPLAPGYRILKESFEVDFVSGHAPRLRIRAHYTLENSGTTPLGFLDAKLPDEKTFGRSDPHVKLDGRDVPLQELPAESQPGIFRVPFEQAWERNQTRDLTIEYTLISPDNSGGRIAIGEDSFHLGSRGWLAVLQPPKHLLSAFPKRPNRTEYTVRVPANFLVLARGTRKGHKKNGNEAEFRFQLRSLDLAPYVVGGPYVPSNRGRRSAEFWTIQPLKDDPAPAAKQIGAAWDVLQKDFGPLDANIHAPYVVESPNLRGHITGEPGPAAASFPGGALVNSAMLALGINSTDFLDAVTHELAHDWFGDEMYASPDSSVGISEGLPEYATIVIEEARNGETGRRRRVIEFLHQYEEARLLASEKPLGLTTIKDAAEQRRIALAKAPLFFVALEDKYGEAPVRLGLKHLVASLRGQEAGYDDLRSALEEAIGQNLAEPFRVWLYGKNIPKDFQERYEAKGPSSSD